MIRELIDVGELRVALELLADNVNEFEIQMTESAQRVVLEVAASVELAQKYIEMLAEPN
jgi:hypothetical protein